MTLIRTGGYAAFACAATYLFGFTLLVTVLAPMGYGTKEIDIDAVAAFIYRSPGIITVWNTTIYIVNGLALLVLVVALSDHLRPGSGPWAQLAQAMGVVWATLVLGAGMIANVATERVVAIYVTSPQDAAALWEILHSVELGLGGGNEIAGAAWILCVSSLGAAKAALPRRVTYPGMITGLAGLATLVPSVADSAGAVFGLGAILWFLLVGRVLQRASVSG